MIKLIQNESIKIFRQTGYKVLMIILLVVAVLIPCVHFGFDLLIDLAEYSWTAEDEYENYIEWAEEEEESGVGSRIAEGAVYRGDAETVLFFLENDLDESWKYNLYCRDLEREYELLKLYQILADGTVEYADVEETGYHWMIEDALMYGAVEEPPYYGDDWNDAWSDYNDYSFNPYLVDWEEEAEKQEAVVEAVKQKILDTTVKDILISSVNGQQAAVTDTEAAVAVAEEELRLAEQNRGTEEGDLLYAEAQYELDLLRADLVSEKEALWAYTFLYDHDCDPDSWQYALVNYEYASYVRSYNRAMVPMPEILWEEQATFLDGDYEDYLESLEKDTYTVYLRDTTAVAKYALEHDVTPADYAETATKSYLHVYISIYMSVVSIFVIVLMGMIVASEYSSGTIRLLVIRPKKRHKILTSKLVAALMYCLGLSFAGMIAMCVLGTLFFGFGDIFEFDIFVSNGHAFAVPALLTFVAEILLILLGILFRASIALCFSALTKKAALAIVIPMVLNTYASTVQLLSIAVGELIPFVKFTILPYLAPEILLSRPLASSSLTDLMYGGSMYGAVEALGAIYGIVLMALSTFGVILGTYLIFNRQQIKS